MHYFPYESITPLRQSLDELRIIGIVAENLPQSIDYLIESPLKIDKNAILPQPFLELLAGHKLTGALHEKRQSLKWLFGEFQSGAMFAQFAGRKINLEMLEANF